MEHLQGSFTGSGTTSIHDSTAPLEIAPHGPENTPPRVPFTGRGHRFEVRDGIDGTLAASPDLRDLAPGTTAWTDSTGLTGPPCRGAVQDWDYLFHAEIASWPTRWDPLGADIHVPLQAARNPAAPAPGRKPWSRLLRRRIPAGSPLAYWPMEDGENATVCYSPIDGVAP